MVPANCKFILEIDPLLLEIAPGYLGSSSNTLDN